MAVASSPYPPTPSFANFLQDQGDINPGADSGPDRSHPGKSVVRKYGQPADGSQLRLPPSLRWGDRPSYLHGRWQGVRRQADDEGRSTTDLRRLYATQQRSCPTGVDGCGNVQDERLSYSTRARAYGNAAIHAAIAQGWQCDRLLVSAGHCKNTRRMRSRA